MPNLEATTIGILGCMAGFICTDNPGSKIGYSMVICTLIVVSALRHG